MFFTKQTFTIPMQYTILNFVGTRNYVDHVFCHHLYFNFTSILHTHLYGPIRHISSSHQHFAPSPVFQPLHLYLAPSTVFNPLICILPSPVFCPPHLYFASLTCILPPDLILPASPVFCHVQKTLVAEDHIGVQLHLVTNVITQRN